MQNPHPAPTLSTTEEILTASTVDEAKDKIRCNLLVSDQWLVRGMMAIHARQTATEQQSQSTRLHNKVGFNATDAGLLSSFADQVKQWQKTPEHQRRYKSPLSPKQLAKARVKMLKYSGQLLCIAKSAKPVT